MNDFRETLMKLFRISQTQDTGYDTFDSAVVAAEDETIAAFMDPQNGEPMTAEEWGSNFPHWCSGPEHVRVTYLGTAAPGITRGVICASFNAG